MSKPKIERDCSRLVIDAGAVLIDTKVGFTWSSGVHSPLYCDHRLLASRPGLRRRLSQELAALVRDQFGEADAIAGVALGAIPWAAWVADTLGLSLVLVRQERKSHGRRRQVEGDLRDVSCAVVIEDVVSTGGSSIRVASSLRALGVSVLGVVAILDYQVTDGALSREGLKLHSVYTYDSLRSELDKSQRYPREATFALDQWYASFQSPLGLRGMTDAFPKAHSVGGVVVNSLGEVAIVSEKDSRWSLPKGHRIGTEDALSTARREIFEETGITDLTLVSELGSYSRFAEDSEGLIEYKTITLFLFTTNQQDLQTRDPDNLVALWIRPPFVASLLSNQADKAFFNQVLGQVENLR
jgi:orotate phosphoribosyltransferase